MRNNTAELSIQLTNLYDNIQRQSTLLGDLQGGQANIRAILQEIERAINMLQGLGEVNVTQLLDMENRIAGINTQVMTLGVTPAVVEETRAVLLSLGKPQQEADLPQSEYERERKIDRERPPVSFIPEDMFVTLGVGQVKSYLIGLWNTGNEDLRGSMGVHMGVMAGPKGGNNINGLVNRASLPRIKENYKFFSEEAKAVLSTKRGGATGAEIPIFAEPKKPSTSEAVGDIFKRTSPRGTSPRSEYKTTREVPQEQKPYDLFGEPTQMASAPRSEGKGILVRGVGIRMTGRGVAPKEKYISLGKYLVNIHKLEHNNIVSFKSPNLKSTNIQSKRVSQPVADILLHIVNGTLDNIVTDNLSEDDISYLFQLIKKCELDNFLDGKAENKIKTKTEQEIHNFYVLQGEIVAGNDNPQIIREFKASLLTMMNEGKLSKKEAGDVLIQMSLLGI
jgi:hypothetical protein